MNTTLRVIQDDAAWAAWNMAVDEAVWELAAPGNGPTLRWYSWSESTLSLGYFQSHGEAPAALAQLPKVRRLSGGGALVHDRELTYSLVFPPGDWPTPSVRDIVQQTHEVFAAVIPGAAFPQRPDDKSADEPFLCFERRDAADVVVRGAKIIGSAQRRRGGRLLQHGGIILARSPFTPAIPGLVDLAATPSVDLIQELTLRLANRWGLTPQPGQLTEAERRLAISLALARYSQPEWNLRR